MLAYNPDQARPGRQSRGGRWTEDPIRDREPMSDDGYIVRISDALERRYTIVLEEEESRGGHALREHVGKTSEQMLARVRASRFMTFFEAYGLRRDGSFESRESANDLVNQALKENLTVVDSVSSGSEAQAFITKRFGFKTGMEAYTNGCNDPYMRTMYGIGVYIFHDPDSMRGYRVHTATPRNDGD